jgi:hypothetical protein
LGRRKRRKTLEVLKVSSQEEFSRKTERAPQGNLGGFLVPLGFAIYTTEALALQKKYLFVSVTGLYGFSMLW